MRKLNVLGSGTNAVPLAGRHGRVAVKVRAPHGAILGLDPARRRIVWQRRKCSKPLAPNYVVGCVDYPVEVVITREVDDRRHLQHEDAVVRLGRAARPVVELSNAGDPAGFADRQRLFQRQPLVGEMSVLRSTAVPVLVQ